MKPEQNVIPCEVQVQGLFKMEKYDEHGNFTGSTDWIPNLITNYGLNYLFENSVTSFYGNINWLAVGTSSVAPSFTDIALGAQVGPRTASRSNNSNTNSGAPLYYSANRNTYTFPQGSIVGNIAEVGLFTSNVGNNAATRALVLDGSGNPTTFTVLGNETLNVVYELRFYPKLTNTSGTVIISGVTYNWEQQSAYYNAANGGAISRPLKGHPSNNQAAYAWASDALPGLGGPTGTPYGTTNYSYAAYGANTFYLDETLTWGPTEGNAPGGIGIIGYGAFSLSSSDNQGFFVKFSPKIPKTNVQTLNLTFRISYARYTP